MCSILMYFYHLSFLVSQTRYTRWPDYRRTKFLSQEKHYSKAGYASRVINNKQ